MSEVNLSLTYILYGLAIVILLVRLLRHEKWIFLLSAAFVVLGSAYSAFVANFSVLYIFFAAIVLSFVGDLLMAQVIRITPHRIVDGVMLFGFAHVTYIIAFYQLNVGNFGDTLIAFVIGGVVVAVVIFYLVAYNPDAHIVLLISTFVYSIVISGVLAIVLAFVFSADISLYAALTAIFGIILFMISDGVLAYNEFKNEIPRAKEIIAATYILAQILLQLTPILTI